MVTVLGGKEGKAGERGDKVRAGQREKENAIRTNRAGKGSGEERRRPRKGRRKRDNRRPHERTHSWRRGDRHKIKHRDKQKWKENVGKQSRKMGRAWERGIWMGLVSPRGDVVPKDRCLQRCRERGASPEGPGALERDSLLPAKRTKAPVIECGVPGSGSAAAGLR